MELQKLHYFVAAAQTQSFRKAAVVCSVAQPVLSRQIAALEKELGARLFERSRRGVRLTAAGHSFIGYARSALDQIQQGRQVLIELGSGVRGDVAVGCVEPLLDPFLVHAFTPFHRQFPNVRLQLRVSGADDLIELVEQRALDFGLFGLPLDWAQVMGLLGLHELFRDQVQLVIPQAHPLAAGREPLLVEHLVAQPCVMLRKGFSVRRAIEEAFARQGHTLMPVVEADTLAGLLTCVRQGVGVTFLPPKLLRSPALGAGLAVRPVHDLLASFAFGIVYRRFERATPAATALINALLRAPIWEEEPLDRRVPGHPAPG